MDSTIKNNIQLNNKKINEIPYIDLTGEENELINFKYDSEETEETTADDVQDINCDDDNLTIKIDNCSDHEPVSNNLKILNLNRDSAPACGGTEVTLFCDKISKDDIKILFYQQDNDEQIIWKSYADIIGVYKRISITFNTPKYDKELHEKIQVNVQLIRPSDGQSSEPRHFNILPNENKKRFYKNDEFDKLENERSFKKIPLQNNTDDDSNSTNDPVANICNYYGISPDQIFYPTGIFLLTKIQSSEEEKFEEQQFPDQQYGQQCYQFVPTTCYVIPNELINLPNQDVYNHQMDLPNQYVYNQMDLPNQYVYNQIANQIKLRNQYINDELDSINEYINQQINLSNKYSNDNLGQQYFKMSDEIKPQMNIEKFIQKKNEDSSQKMSQECDNDNDIIPNDNIETTQSLLLCLEINEVDYDDLINLNDCSGDLPVLSEEIITKYLEN